MRRPVAPLLAAMLASFVAIGVTAHDRSTPIAQLLAAKDGRVVMGHVGLNSTSLEKHRTFWTALGGTVVTLFGREMFAFTNVYVSPSHGSDPTGGTEGTTVNHLGFQTADLTRTIADMRAAGYAPVERVRPENAPRDLFFLGPDGVLVEVTERPGLPFKTGIDHIHFAARDPVAMRDWYVRVLGATPTEQNGTVAAVLPGVSLLFDLSAEPVRGTAGRVVDHVSFEIRGLPEFCAERARAGVTFDRPYSKPAALDLGVAFLTDPFGTAIELTEGYYHRGQ